MAEGYGFGRQINAGEFEAGRQQAKQVCSALPETRMTRQVFQDWVSSPDNMPLASQPADFHAGFWYEIGRISGARFG